MSRCDVLSRVVRAREALEDGEVALVAALLEDLESDLATSVLEKATSVGASHA